MICPKRVSERKKDKSQYPQSKALYLKRELFILLGIKENKTPSEYFL